MTYEQILEERRDDVLVLTMNRPERLNAWTTRMSAELTHAIRAANDDDAVTAVVLTGAGRGFCAGADIGAEFAPAAQGTGPRAGAQEGEAAGLAPGHWVRLCRESKPLVAAVNGAAVGVGLSMILPFDVIVAARGAKLSARFVKMGVVPELASSHFLVARCGWGAASWLALSGTTLLAEEAAELRLVDRLSEPDTVLDDAVAVAAEIGANPAPQLRMVKDLLTANASETDLDAVMKREFEALDRAYRTPEHREAVAAFLEKRPPKFR